MSIRKVVLIIALLCPIAAVCAEDSGPTRVQVDKIVVLDKDTGFLRPEGGVGVKTRDVEKLAAERAAPSKFHVQIDSSRAGWAHLLPIGGQILCEVSRHCSTSRGGP